MDGTVANIPYENGIDYVDYVAFDKSGYSANNAEESSVTSKYLYFLNAPDNPSVLIGCFGHAALLLESASTNYELYNFSSFNNKSPLAKGSIAQTVDEIHSFDSFVEACKADNFRGIRINNGYREWNEPYKRAIKLCVTDEQLNKIRNFALAVKKRPPWFNFFFGYNCMGFCYTAFKCADTCFVDDRGLEVAHVFANSTYKNAEWARNVMDFEKIDFREW